MAIELFYTYFNQPLDPPAFDYYLSQMPEDIQQRIARYLRWEDKHRCLLGRLLLANYLGDYKALRRLEYSPKGRPFLATLRSFSISHSQEMVMLAVSKNMEVGIDVEWKKPITNYGLFRHVLHDEEWEKLCFLNQNMKTAPMAKALFYKIWTRKEAFIKMLGEGLHFPVQQVSMLQNVVLWRGQSYYLNYGNFPLLPDLSRPFSYAVCSPINKESESLELDKVQFIKF